MTSKTASRTIAKMISLKPLYDAAKAATLASRCLEEDCLGGGSEPVTVSGWYSVYTKSGRAAWRHYAWISGRLRTGVCTYDLGAETRYVEIAHKYGELDWFCDQDTELRREAHARGLAL